MAGWGTGSFENEDAQKWLGKLSLLGIDDLKQILSRAADQSDYLEAPDASIVVAAAEVLATMKGAPPEQLPREIVDWTTRTKGGSTAEINELAVRAVDKVRRNSELKDLWLEADGLNEWTAALQDLQTRLSS
ncbi:MAG TPA: DUF4259 domain-containing protein [Terriglobales bacterium]|jgi:hypothetical protein